MPISQSGFDMDKYMSSFGESAPVSSAGRALQSEAYRYRFEQQKKLLQHVKEKEFKEAYDSLLKLYSQYSGKEDDVSQIMKAYYLELIQDLQDDKKRESTLSKWASGMIRGIPAKPHYIGGVSSPVEYQAAIGKIHKKIISSYK